MTMFRQSVEESLALDEIQRLLDISAPTSVLERVVVGNKVGHVAPIITLTLPFVGVLPEGVGKGGKGEAS